ncbi:MAG: hypothetical protein ACJ8F7_12265 [Gemmataceae bacterium]
MPLTCPVCRAANEQGPACRRCRADLSLLFALESQRGAQVAVAGRALALRQPDVAESHARAADDLRRGADVHRLLAAAHMLRRDFAAAWNEYHRARSMAGG